MKIGLKCKDESKFLERSGVSLKTRYRGAPLA